MRGTVIRYRRCVKIMDCGWLGDDSNCSDLRNARISFASVRPEQPPERKRERRRTLGISRFRIVLPISEVGLILIAAIGGTVSPAGMPPVAICPAGGPLPTLASRLLRGIALTLASLPGLLLLILVLGGPRLVAMPIGPIPVGCLSALRRALEIGIACPCKGIFRRRVRRTRGGLSCCGRDRLR